MVKVHFPLCHEPHLGFRKVTRSSNNGHFYRWIIDYSSVVVILFFSLTKKKWTCGNGEGRNKIIRKKGERKGKIEDQEGKKTERQIKSICSFVENTEELVSTDDEWTGVTRTRYVMLEGPSCHRVYYFNLLKMVCMLSTRHVYSSALTTLSVERPSLLSEMRCARNVKLVSSLFVCFSLSPSFSFLTLLFS